MSHVRTSPSFADRFERLLSSLRAARLVTAVAWLIGLLALGLGVLAALDYTWELDRSTRALGLAFVVTIPPLFALVLAVRSLRACSRGRTASEIERRHPELGQSVRTTVQFRSADAAQLRAQGVSPTIVAALEAETGERTEPIRFDEFVPRGLARTGLLAAAVLVAAVLVPARFDGEWRTALGRSLLGETPYTTVAASASTDRVEAEGSVALQVDVHGRQPARVALWWRNVGDSEWRESTFDPEDAATTSHDAGVSTYESVLDRVTKPIEYRAVAGRAESELGRVDVHYPIVVRTFAIDVEPPAYTGLEDATIVGGSIDVVKGTRLRFRVELDQPPATAELVVSDTRAGEREERRIPFVVEGTHLTVELEPEEDLYFRVAATAEDGTRLDEVRHRIRVRFDQPPRIWFEEPYDIIEVHALAEVMMRIRVQDDFGVARAGIVFEVNNEEEYELLGEEFEQAIDDLAAASGSARRTAAVLERVLPLEYFELTQKDSVAYYAYVEDNFPDRPHRVETDLRFVDVRPFRRLFTIRDAMEGDGEGGGPRVPSLDEIIGRQRYALNRTIRLGKRAEHGEDVALDAIDRMIRFQNELATESRRLAEFLQAREIEGNDSLFQAEERMLVAVDSLSVGNYETSGLQQKDALRYLIDARNKVEVTLGGPNKIVITELMRFSSQQAQSMRRPRNENEREVEQIVERLRRMAGTERRVAGDVAGLAGAMPDEMPSDDTGGDDPADNPADEPSGPSREEILDTQVAVGLDARDLERILSTIEEVSELARERIGTAAGMAEGVTGAIERGETDEAREGAERAAEAFDELATNIEGLLTRESADKVAVARDVARAIAEAQRRIGAMAEPAEDGGGTGGSTPEESSDEDDEVDTAEERNAAIAGALERSVESGRTLLDVLESIPRNATIEDDVAVGQVENLIDTEEPGRVVERMAALPATARAGKLDEVREETTEAARAMETVAVKLDEIRRRIVEPRVRELLDLEQRAAELNEELDELETQEDVTGWHREADRLTEELEGAGLAEEPREELEDAMRGEGWEQPRPDGWKWEQDEDGGLTAPTAYGEALQRIETRLQEHVRELILRERSSDADERTPPDYRHLVERYFKVLATGPNGPAGDGEER